MKATKLHIKNMVCPRCISSVESILKSQSISFSNGSLGEINLIEPINLLHSVQKSNWFKPFLFVQITFILNYFT